MTKLEKLKADFDKAEKTFQNARKRKNLLAAKIREEEQREVQTLMQEMGVTAADIRELLGSEPSPPPEMYNDEEMIEGGTY